MFTMHELEDFDFCLHHLKALLKAMQDGNHGTTKVRDLPAEPLQDYRALAHGIAFPALMEEGTVDDVASVLAPCRGDVLREVMAWD
jgi:hypothetical protein